MRMHAFSTKNVISLVTAATVGALTLSAQAQTQQTPGNKNKAPLDGATAILSWAEQEERSKALLRFAGKPMDTARARQISRAAGFRFIGWSTCAGAQNCFVATVKGARGGVFNYVVHGQNCLSVKQDPTKAPPLDREAASGPASDRVEVPRSVQQTQNDGETAKRKHCFGGYTTVSRARIHASYLVDHDSHFYKTSRTWQRLHQSKWDEIASFSIMDWRHRLPDSAQEEIGYAYEVLNGAGESLEDKGEVVYAIAGSNASDGKRDKAEMCEQERNKKLNSLKRNAHYKSLAACYLIPFPTQLVIELGEGASLAVGKEVDWCSTNEALRLLDAEEAAQQTYDDCIENPGRYDPKNFEPIPDPFSLESVLGNWEPLEPQTVSGRCELNRVTETTNQVDGVFCTVTVQESCDPNAEGCPCTVRSTQQICVSGGTKNEAN